MKYATPKISGVGPERRGRGQGHDQHGGRRREDGQANGAFLRVEGVRQPGIGGPRPPQGREEEDAAQQPVCAQVLREEPGDLRDGEDEDEIEEQLERRDPLLALDRRTCIVGSLPDAATAS